MKTEIIQPHHPELKNIVQYFILFKSEKDEKVEYSTFPNTNLCLAIYKQNKIILEQNKTSKHLFTLKGNATYKSYLSGFHESNLNVSINTTLDEVCIIFHPAALRLFTNISYDELIKSDEVFEMIFPKSATDFTEQLFEEKNSLKRISMLENILLKSLNQNHLNTKTKEILYLIQQTDELKVSPLAKQLSINESTLYRLFMNQIGQSPKSFLKTVRFRKALDSILHFENEKLTHIAYQNNYTDQSHFIRDFKEITGQSPNQLRNKTNIQQEQLAWIYAQH
ncbi:helix-turn-helix domain-containing protein [Empedobacter falsenii]